MPFYYRTVLFILSYANAQFLEHYSTKSKKKNVKNKIEWKSLSERFIVRGLREFCKTYNSSFKKTSNGLNFVLYKYIPENKT